MIINYYLSEFVFNHRNNVLSKHLPNLFDLGDAYWCGLYLSLSQIRFEKLLQFIPRNHILGFALTYEFSISTIVEVAM